MAFSSVLVFLMAVALWHGCLTAAQSCQNVSNPMECCTCRDQPSKVTLHVLNVLKEPRVDSRVEVDNTSQQYLLGIMEQASKTSTDWRFSVTYFDQSLGFSLDTYHGVTANYTLDRTYWSILGGDNKPIPLGISSYVPVDGDQITFNLTADTTK
ncbi:hypothetical protein ACOMHN_051835 [Nucella lapillus]